MKLELATVERLNLGLSAGAVAACYAFVTPHFATSLAAGACLEAINLGAMHRGARKLFGGDLVGARSWVGVFSLRFVLLAVAILLAMQVGADPAALLIGLSIAMPATVIDAWIHRPPVIDPATLPVLPEPEADDDAAYWESYSVWRPGHLLTTQRDDLLSELAAQAADGERVEARVQSAEEADARTGEAAASIHSPSRPTTASSAVAADE